MFIIRSRVWGPVAGVATALLVVWLLGSAGEQPNRDGPLAAGQIASVTGQSHH